MSAIVLMTTLPADRDASVFARKMIEARLAACVNVISGVQSHYEWQGEMVSDQESVLFIKSREDKIEALKAFFRNEHPYEVPEFVVLSIADPNVPYVHWVNQVLGTK